MIDFKRTEGGIMIRNWEPKKEIIEGELDEFRRTTQICSTMTV